MAIATVKANSFFPEEKHRKIFFILPLLLLLSLQSKPLFGQHVRGLYIVGEPTASCLSARSTNIHSVVISFYVNLCSHRIQVMTCDEGGTQGSCGLFEMRPYQDQTLSGSMGSAPFFYGQIAAVCKGEYIPYTHIRRHEVFTVPGAPYYCVTNNRNNFPDTQTVPEAGEWVSPQP